MNVQKLVGNHYLAVFYNNFLDLKSYYAQYNNLLKELKFTHGETPDSKNLNDIERKQLIEICQLVRYYASLIRIEIKDIFKKIKDKEIEEIEQLYKPLDENYIIPIADVYRFVSIVNKIVIDEVIQELLVNAQDVYQQIYDNANTNK